MVKVGDMFRRIGHQKNGNKQEEHLHSEKDGKEKIDLVPSKFGVVSFGDLSHSARPASLYNPPPFDLPDFHQLPPPCYTDMDGFENNVHLISRRIPHRFSNRIQCPRNASKTAYARPHPPNTSQPFSMILPS